MPLEIIIENTSHRIMIAKDEDMSLEQLRQQIAELLEVQPTDFESIQVAISPSKKIGIHSNNEKHMLKTTYNLGNQDRIKVQANIKTELMEDYQTTLSTARQDLVTALHTAQNERANVIITVGSCMQSQHGNESLFRQQLPIQHLGHISETAPVHFIHIDPGFAAPVPGIKQIHEMDDWMLIAEESNLTKVYAHRILTYTITTISAPIMDFAECHAYFNHIGKSHTLFGVDLLKYQLKAEKMGTGFVTANFYDPGSQPILIRRPEQDSLDENITPNM